MIARPRRRTLLSASAFILSSLFVGHLGSFYGWTPGWTVAAAAVFLVTLRSGVAAAWFLLREPFAVCDFGLSEAAWPGGAVGCALEIEARRPVRIQEASVTLTGERRDREGRTHTLSRETRVLATDVTLRPGARLERREELSVPADLPASWRLEQERVRWLVAARVRAEGFSPAKERIVLPVMPRPGDPPAAGAQSGTETTNAS